MCCECEAGMDMERSEVGVPSSTTAEADEGCWLAWRLFIWACWVRIILRRRLT